jgi:hypothetical protein
MSQRFRLEKAVRILSSLVGIKMYRTAFLLTVLLTRHCMAGLTEAREAVKHLFPRQSDGSNPNAIQNWENDYASVNYTFGDGGEFDMTWNNGFGGNFVIGRGYQPARDMYVYQA